MLRGGDSGKNSGRVIVRKKGTKKKGGCSVVGKEKGSDQQKNTKPQTQRLAYSRMEMASLWRNRGSNDPLYFLSQLSLLQTVWSLLRFSVPLGLSDVVFSPLESGG